MRENRKSHTEISGTIAPIVERNIQTLLARRRAEEARQSWGEKLAARVTRFTGSLPFVYFHLVLYGLWIAINVGWIPAVPRFDPTLVILAMEASVEAIFLSTFILITQQEMMARSDKRAELNLQISLLAEHEITRIMTITRQIARGMGVKEAEHPELEELEQDTAPEEVLAKIDENEKEAGKSK